MDEDDKITTYKDALEAGMVQNPDGSTAEVLGDEHAQRREHSLDSQFEEHQTRQKERRQEAEAETAEKAETERQQQRADERAQVEISGEDREAVARHVERQRAFQADLANYQKARQQAETSPGEVTLEQRRLLAEVEDRLRGEAEAIQAGNQFLQTELQKRQAQARRHGMFEGVPELRDAETAGEFVKWAARKHGVSEARVRAETNADLVGREFRAFQDHQKQKASEAKAAKVADEARRLYSGDPVLGGDKFPVPKNASEALERLKRTNSMSDALAVLSLRKEEKRHG